MRLDTGDIMADEFEAYFARAQSVEKEIPQISYGKRGSNPDVNKNTDVPCLRRAKSCKSNYRRRGCTKGTPTRDLPTQVRADLDNENEEARECAGLSHSFNENKLKESYRLLEVKGSPQWNEGKPPILYVRGRSDSATPGLNPHSSNEQLSSHFEQMTLDVPTDNHLALPRHTSSPSSSSRESSSPAIRRRRRFDKMKRGEKSKSVGVDMMEASSSGGSDSPTVEVADGEEGDGGNNQGVKIHLIGDYGVGKKSIVQQFKNKSLFSNPSVHDGM